jgi:hypothetical protein
MMKMSGKKMEPSAPSYNHDCAFSFHGSGGGGCLSKIFFEEVPDTKKGDMEERVKGMRRKRRRVRKKTE